MSPSLAKAISDCKGLRTKSYLADVLLAGASRPHRFRGRQRQELYILVLPQVSAAEGTEDRSRTLLVLWMVLDGQNVPPSRFDQGERQTEKNRSIRAISGTKRQLYFFRTVPLTITYRIGREDRPVGRIQAIQEAIHSSMLVAANEFITSLRRSFLVTPS